MLYVSRVLFDGDEYGDYMYGIVDTDDDVEEVVTWEVMSDAVVHKRVKILGTFIDEIAETIGYPFMSRADPYQDPRYITMEMAKLKTLLGVELIVWRDEVTSIFIDCDTSARNVKFRLSDYCRRLSGVSPTGWTTGSPSIKNVTILLDDKIEIYGGSFPVIFDSGINWDISEVTNVELISRLYNYVLMHYPSMREWNTSIIDKDKRIENGLICFG